MPYSRQQLENLTVGVGRIGKLKLPAALKRRDQLETFWHVVQGRKDVHIGLAYDKKREVWEITSNLINGAPPPAGYVSAAPRQ